MKTYGSTEWWAHEPWLGVWVVRVQALCVLNPLIEEKGAPSGQKCLKWLFVYLSTRV